jgi:hypothetical protein
MKLHGTVIEKLVHLFQTYGGSPNETVLKKHLLNLDLTPYERKTTPDQEIILVDTKDYFDALPKKAQ